VRARGAKKSGPGIEPEDAIVLITSLQRHDPPGRMSLYHNM